MPPSTKTTIRTPKQKSRKAEAMRAEDDDHLYMWSSQASTRWPVGLCPRPELTLETSTYGRLRARNELVKKKYYSNIPLVFTTLQLIRSRIESTMNIEAIKTSYGDDDISCNSSLCLAHTQTKCMPLMCMSIEASGPSTGCQFPAQANTWKYSLWPTLPWIRSTGSQNNRASETLICAWRYNVQPTVMQEP